MKKYVVALFVFMVCALFLFSRPLNGYFISDDWHWLWSAHEHGSIVPDLTVNYAGERAGGSYNPISSLWINSLYHTFGLRAVPYHIASIMLHALNAWLVMLLAFIFLKLFILRKNPSVSAPTLAMLAGGIFLIWPTHAEAVNWIASVPHLLMTAWSLVSIILYIVWLRRRRTIFFTGSLIACVLALFSKETAISVPFILLFLEWYYQRTVEHKKSQAAYYRWTWFIVISICFFAMRFFATGLFVGSYAEPSLILRPWQMVNTLLTFFEEMLTLGIARVGWMWWFWQYTIGTSLVALASIGGTGWYLFKHHKTIVYFLGGSFIISLVPFIPLGFNRVSQESERYTYFPSVFFIFGLVILISELRNVAQRAVVYFVICFAAVSLLLIRNEAWYRAGMTSATIISESAQHIVEGGAETYLFVALPDTIAGAHVFRNNLREALALTHPELSKEIILLPVYQQLSLQNYDQETLAWKADERGFFARSTDGSYVVTGTDRRESNLLTYELWNYDYTNFTSDTIRLILSDDTKSKIQSGALQLMIWDRGAIRDVSFVTTP